MKVIVNMKNSKDLFKFRNDNIETNNSRFE